MTSTRSILPAALAATLVLAISALSQDPPEQPVQPAPATNEATATGNAEMIADAAEDQTYLGLSTIEVPGFLGKQFHLHANTGLLVQAVDPGSPAAKAGFTVDDIITKVDGNPVASQRELANIIHARKSGDQLELEYIHEGTPGKRGVQLGAHRPDPQAQDDAAVAELQMNPDAGNPNANPPPMAQKLMRDALEKVRKNAGQQMNLQIVPGGAGGIQILPGGGAAGGLRIQGNVNLNSSIRMTDGEGSIEMNNADGGSEIRVLDKAGKEVWSGPWESAQDKAAAPPDIRQRIERLNLAPQGFRLAVPPPGDKPDHP